MKRRPNEARRPRGRRGRATGVALGMTAFAVAGCDGLLDVENPNNVLQADVEQPTAATALVNGLEARVYIATGWVMRTMSTASDEFQWAGSWDASREITHGNWWNPGNPDVNDSFNQMSVARWMADETVALVDEWAQEGLLARAADHVDAHLYAGLTKLMLGEYWEDFVYSNRTEAGPPIGEQNMVQLFDEALNHFTRVRQLAQQAGDAEKQRIAVALQARAHFGKALWPKLQPRGNTPSDPLVASAEAVASAEELISLASGQADWRYAFSFTPGTRTNAFASFANSRREIAPSRVYVEHDQTGRAVAEVTLQDPIDGVVDPMASRLIWEFVDGFQHSPQPITSVREMHLIIAEAALAQGDGARFREHINAIRSLDGLTPYDGQIPEQDMLYHARRVNLYGMGRRLHDHYRFGTQSPDWLPNSNAATRPGSFLPIGEEERQTNCYLLGTC